jgi:hypothetical protein
LHTDRIEYSKGGPSKSGRVDMKAKRKKTKFAEGLIPQKVVNSAKMNVSTNTTVSSVEKGVMKNQTAKLTPSKNHRIGMTPRYLHFNLWDPTIDSTCCTSDWTETAKPLSCPPPEEFENVLVQQTIHDNPNLFKIVTPIYVNIFESYLVSHPNSQFVSLVCQGLREGFWPWATTQQPGYPETLDNSKPTPVETWKANFLCSQMLHKLSMDCFSPSFRKVLHPGMYCMPIYAVSIKPHSPDLHLVTDQSHGKFSLNSMIDHDQVIGYPLDNMVQFSKMLLNLEK